MAENPTVDIFIMTYGADAYWTRYCLKSIRKYLTGFRDIVVGCPENVPAVEKACTEHNARLFTFEHKDPGHMQQQVYKMSADLHCKPGVDWIMLLDADCIFTHPVTVESQFVRGRPIYCYDEWEADHTYQWQEGTEKFAGWTIQYNFMRRHGMCFKPQHLQRLRKHVESRHGDFESAVMGQWDETTEWFPAREGDRRWQPWGKPTLSEFCLMGSLMWRMFHRDFCWWNVADFDWPGGERYSFFKQFWSHYDVQGDIKKELEEITA
jgi:hypothetical protein